MVRGRSFSSFFIFLKGLLSMWVSSFSSAFVLLTLRRYKLRTLKKLFDMDDEERVVLVVCWRSFVVEIVGTRKRTHASPLASGCCQVVRCRWDHREHCFRESNQRQSSPADYRKDRVNLVWRQPPMSDPEGIIIRGHLLSMPPRCRRCWSFLITSFCWFYF